MAVEVPSAGDCRPEEKYASTQWQNEEREQDMRDFVETLHAPNQIESIRDHPPLASCDR